MDRAQSYSLMMMMIMMMINHDLHRGRPVGPVLPHYHFLGGKASSPRTVGAGGKARQAGRQARYRVPFNSYRIRRHVGTIEAGPVRS